jgi:hypothetical protein
MIADEIRTLMRSAPFRPFRVHLADGTDVLIHHHDYAWLEPSGTDFYVVDQDGLTHFINTEQVTKLTRTRRADGPKGGTGHRQKPPPRK